MNYSVFDLNNYSIQRGVVVVVDLATKVRSN